MISIPALNIPTRADSPSTFQRTAQAMVETAHPTLIAPRARRIDLLDLLRGIALIAMAIFHLSWDLEFFHYLEPGTVSSLGMKLFARSIASSFLFLAGFSLFLGHFPQIRVRPFLKRFAMVAVSAAAITAATLYFMPDEFIFFGILHCIATASLIGLVFLRLPWLVALLVAIGAILAPWYLRSDLFNVPWLWWVGLSTDLPRSNDYVPLLPWFGPFLLGLAAAKVFHRRLWLERLSHVALPQNRFISLLTKAGRNSLIFYLVHQPVLIACVWCFSQLVPVSQAVQQADYLRTCESSCSLAQEPGFCTAFCSCTLDKLLEKNMFSDLQLGTIDVANDARIASISALCSAGAQ
jgi:uncharacterized membrane protein